MSLKLSGWDPEGTLRLRARIAMKKLVVEAEREERVALTINYFFCKRVEAEKMTKDEEAKKFWDTRIIPKEREIQALVADCKKQGRRTVAYDNAIKDMNKLKKEYEDIKGGKPYDPHSLADVETAAVRTARQFLGDKRA